MPIQTSSPERRITSQKEIIAGEERPKYLLIKQLQETQQSQQQQVQQAQQAQQLQTQQPGTSNSILTASAKTVLSIFNLCSTIMTNSCRTVNYFICMTTLILM